jgi:hypothetical protein
MMVLFFLACITAAVTAMAAVAAKDARLSALSRGEWTLLSTENADNGDTTYIYSVTLDIGVDDDDAFLFTRATTDVRVTVGKGTFHWSSDMETE